MTAIIISLDNSSEDILATEPEYKAAQEAAINDMKKFDPDLDLSLLSREDRDVYLELTALHYMSQQQFG